MNTKLLTEHNLEFLSLTDGCMTHVSLHLSKCHTVGNLMSRLNYLVGTQKDRLIETVF